MISALQEYGVRCLVQLAKHGAETPMSAREIAEAEGLSLDYVEKILWTLRQEELVVSQRGVNGGFNLSRPAEETTLLQVFRALGGPLYYPGFCNDFSGQRETCTHVSECSVRPLWLFLSRHLDGVLSGTTLAQFMNEELAVRQQLQSMANPPTN